MNKFPALLALLAVGGSAFGLLALPGRWNFNAPKPPPGKYVGVLAVNRSLIEEGLDSSYTMKVTASIGTDGKITILSAAPEEPGAAANIDNSVVRAVPNPAVMPPPSGGTIRITDQAQTQTLPAPKAQSVPSNRVIQTSGNLVTLAANYLVNGSIPAFVSANGKMVYLNYSVIKWKPNPAVLPIPPGVGSNGSPVGLNTSPSSQTSATTSPASQATAGIYLPDPGTTLPLPPVQIVDSRVSFGYTLRFQRALPTPGPQ